MEDLTKKITNIVLSKNKPISLVHFVTNLCNARCSHCFIDFDNKDSQNEKMSLEDIVKVTKTVGTQLMNVNLTGGEPFLRKDLYEIAKAYIENAKVNSVFITTNGGFTDKTITFAKKFNEEFPSKVLLFSISLDGNEKTHDLIRRKPGLYQKAMATYHQLKKIGPNILVNFGITLTPFNYDTAIDFYSFLKNEILVDSVTVTLAREEGVFKLDPSAKSKMIEAYDTITKLIYEDIDHKGATGFGKHNYLGRMINEKNKIMTKLISETFKNDEFILPCQSARLFGVVYSNGDVYPCEVLDKPMGNLKEFDYNFSKLWKSPKAKSTSKWILDSKCHCTYECAWSYNILASKKYYFNFINAILNF